MDYTVKTFEGGTIMGLKQRTDNTKAMNVIPGLWESFLKTIYWDRSMILSRNLLFTWFIRVMKVMKMGSMILSLGADQPGTGLL